MNIVNFVEKKFRNLVDGLSHHNSVQTTAASSDGTENAIFRCKYCGFLVRKPCLSQKESEKCPNTVIDYKLDSEEFDPTLN